MEALSQLFTLLSEPVRLKLLAMLAQGEKCVCKLHEPLCIQQSTASRHLGLLRTAGVVTARRVGTWMHYRLSPETWREEWKEVLPLAIAVAEKHLTSSGGINACSPAGSCATIPDAKPERIE